MNRELPDVQAGFRKGRRARDQIANIHWIMEKAREFQKNIYLCFIDYAKAFDCVDHNKVILSRCLFNLYAEYIMRNAGLDEAQAGNKITGRNINNLRYANDTTLMAESEGELKSLFSSSLPFAIREVFPPYPRLLIFLPGMLIPACDSSSSAFCMMYSASKLNKQDDNMQS